MKTTDEKMKDLQIVRAKRHGVESVILYCSPGPQLKPNWKYTINTNKMAKVELPSVRRNFGDVRVYRIMSGVGILEPANLIPPKEPRLTRNLRDAAAVAHTPTSGLEFDIEGLILKTTVDTVTLSDGHCFTHSIHLPSDQILVSAWNNIYTFMTICEFFFTINSFITFTGSPLE